MRISDIELESPLINAGGLVKSIEDAQLMSQTAVGAVLAGSYTLEERFGNGSNGQTVYYHDPKTGITYNSLGMPNKSLPKVAKELPAMIQIAHDNGKAFILNFAPVSDDPIMEVITMVEVLAKAGVEELDAIELNASCPNVVMDNGSRHELLSHHPQLLGEVLLELSDVSVNEVPCDRLMVRISPFLQEGDAQKLATVVAESGADTISAFNTFPGGVPVDARGNHILQVPGGMGGQSGAGMRSRAEEQMQWLVTAREAINADFEIIGSNGISDAESMKRRLDMGAAAVSATTLFWEARSWAQAADELLRSYAELVG